MKALYFDCQMGASTSALLAALFDVPSFESKIKSVIEEVELFDQSYKLESKRVERNGVSARQVKLLVRASAAVANGKKEKASTAAAKFDGKSPFTKETNKELNAFIKSQHIPMPVKTTLASIFHRLCSAEARTKHISLEGVPINRLFSPSGFLETIAFVLALHALEVEKVFCSNIGLGSGVITVEGETISLPRACTLELFKESGVPITLTAGAEATTPLAAALLCELATPSLSPVSFAKIEAIAYGASRVEGQPAIRLLIGELAEPNGETATHASENERFAKEEAVVIETNLDDSTPQAVAYACDALLHMGAADVFVVPCLMKKGRAGHLLTVI
jgi:pyridinium-3,5-bisthiocarboxylic acid mononucleotide nickel chelatase